MDAEAMRIYSVRQNGLKGDPILRLILVGDAGVGKSSLLFHYVDGLPVIPENYLPTIGVDFRYKTILLPLDGGSTQPVKLQLWDTAGHERFRSISTGYYRSADVVVLVYDITNRLSFLNIRHWIDVIENMAGRRPIYVLVGNKTDLEDRREVSQAEAVSYADAIGAGFTEVSLLETDATAATAIATHTAPLDILFEKVARAALDQRIEKAAMPKTIRLMPEFPTKDQGGSPTTRSFFSAYC